MSNGSLFCLDWESLDLSLYGAWQTSSDYRVLDVMAVPCLTKLSVLGDNYKGDEGMRNDCHTDFDSTIDYMEGPIDIVMYTNHVRFDTETYGESRLKKTSYFQSKQLLLREPSWVESHIDSFEVIDEVDVLQLGQQDSGEFKQIKNFPAANSNYRKWPTAENPDGIWKFGAFWIEQGQNKIFMERSTYSLLEWLGDIGGLFDALLMIGGALFGPIAAFMMKAELLQLAFRIPPESGVSKSEQKVQMATKSQPPTRL